MGIALLSWAEEENSIMTQLETILKQDLGVKETYRHAPKRVTPGAPIEVSGTILKWYRLYSESGLSASSGSADATNNVVVTVEQQQKNIPSALNEIEQLARSYLTKSTLEAKGLGFVILHQCGRDFYFLIVSTWRGNNELWETVFYKDGEAMSDFALWSREGMHKPTFCVWELMPVWHEAKSWERFLISARDKIAAAEWLNDLYAGAA